jgi:hypothetical protein
MDWYGFTFAPMMEAVRTCETLVNLQQSTRRCNPEDSHLNLEKIPEISH